MAKRKKNKLLQTSIATHQDKNMTQRTFYTTTIVHYYSLNKHSWQDNIEKVPQDNIEKVPFITQKEKWIMLSNLRERTRKTQSTHSESN